MRLPRTTDRLCTPIRKRCRIGMQRSLRGCISRGWCKCSGLANPLEEAQVGRSLGPAPVPLRLWQRAGYHLPHGDRAAASGGCPGQGGIRRHMRQGRDTPAAGGCCGRGRGRTAIRLHAPQQFLHHQRVSLRPLQRGRRARPPGAYPASPCCETEADALLMEKVLGSVNPKGRAPIPPVAAPSSSRRAPALVHRPS